MVFAMDLALTFSLILALGIAAQWLAWFLKQPSILFLLLAGIIIGPLLGLVEPDTLFADWLFPFISLGVAVILFEGAMTLEFHEIRKHGTTVTRLITLGVLITVITVAASAYYLFDMDWRIALLLGTLVCVTGPTVIVPMLRSLRPNSKISNILRWEGILIDPIGALMVVLVFAYINSGVGKASLLVFAKTLAVGVAIGGFAALVLVLLVKKHLIPEYLKNVFTLAWVLLVFSLSNAVEHESGLVTVTVMGIVLANWPKFPKEEILHFKESLSIILTSVLFIVLAARIDPGGFAAMGYSGLVVLAVIMLIARPVGVVVSSLGSDLTRQEKLMISWIAPRGIVAAAVSSLFVIKLEPYDLQGTELLVPLVFTVIIGTVTIQSLAAKPIGRALGVSQPNANGILISGGNDVALALGCSLADNGIPVLVANPNYKEIKKARMAGLNTYYGNPVSEHADRHLELLGIGHLFAMSVRHEANILAALKYRHEFGSKNIYRLKVKDATAMTTKEKTHQGWQTPWLFGEKITFAQLNSLLSKGATIKTTHITEDFTIENYRQEKQNNEQHYVLLYAISPDKQLKVFSSAKTPDIDQGDKVAALVLEVAEIDNERIK
ncbi:MAG: sodium:proton antiporter [Gammaproteobacteria bacterium]|nr:MAG: sodium:proton antiporter [Gammaproteobacteria bacterium]